MKKYSIYAFMSAIALTGAVGFSSCSSAEDQAEVNPGYSADTGEVPVQLVFNISTGNTPTTRQSQANVQATSEDLFRGMDQSVLMSNKNVGNTTAHHIVAAGTADKVYGLGTIFTAEAIGPNSETKSHRVLELSLPTNTDNLMFWGKAKKNGTNKAQGNIDFTVDKTLANCSFKLLPILSETAAEGQLTEKEKFIQYQTLIATLLNDIVHTYYSGNVTYEGDHNVDLKWSDFANVVVTDGVSHLEVKSTSPLEGYTTEPISALGEVLSKAFVTFNSIGGNELRAGSGPAVERMLVDLYTVINRVAEANATSFPETVCKLMGSKIRTTLERYITSGGAWQSLNTIKSNCGLNAADISGVTQELNTFPSSFDMPEGATVLGFTIDASDPLPAFSYYYRDQIPTYDMGGNYNPETYFNIFNYRYPAELCYFGNSAIRVTTDTHVPTDFPEGTTKWDNDAQWIVGINNNTVNWTKDGSVLSSTRSVAMQDNINYGTSLLKTTVKYATDASPLNDNNKGIHPSEADNTIEVKDNSFILTGICIGGQEQEMGWNYLAKSASSFPYMIYDSDIPNGAIPASGTSAANYTLVWDNWNETKKGNKQNVVYVALEFKNNTEKDFWGENNLIRAGGTFYITAKLDPDENLSSTDRGAGITWPTNYALPPYNADNGTTIQERRVFIQDYMTNATFVIGKNSLKKALLAVPDLREAQMSVGLSVDLKWSTGLTFETVLGQ